MQTKRFELLNVWKYISSMGKFKTVYLLGILLSAYGVISSGGNGFSNNMLDTIIETFTFPMFNALFFLLLLKNTAYICTVINNKLGFFIIRFNSKKKYVTFLLKNILFSNILLIIIIMLLYISFLNFFTTKTIIILNHEFYSISNILYLTFYITRYLFIAVLISVLFALSYINFRKKSIILVMIIVIGFFLFPIGLSVENSFSPFIWKYFYSVHYENFNLEFVYSLAYILGLFMICFILSYYTWHNKKVEIS